MERRVVRRVDRDDEDYHYSHKRAGAFQPENKMRRSRFAVTPMPPGQGEENGEDQRNEKAFFTRVPEHGVSSAGPNGMGKLPREQSQQRTTERQRKDRRIKTLAHAVGVEGERRGVQDHGRKNCQAKSARHGSFTQRQDQDAIAPHLHQFDRDPQRHLTKVDDGNEERIRARANKRGPAIRRSPIPVLRRADVPKRVVLCRAPVNFVGVNDPELD